MLLGETGAELLTWETGDIADLARLREIVHRHDIRSIINLAGLQVPFCKANPPLGARVNVEGTINVLETARDRNIRRLAYASSVAALGMPPGGAYLSTLYGAYKLANEYTAKVYSMDWGVPSVGLRPNVVYGVGRDQGMSSSFTVGIACAVQGDTHDIPYTGALSWLYAGEAAAAFIAAVSRDEDDAMVFDLNGQCETVENGLDILARIAGSAMDAPPDLSDEPLREHVGDYPSISVETGIALTHKAFVALESEGRLVAAA